jgi:hypothetical protein
MKQNGGHCNSSANNLNGGAPTHKRGGSAASSNLHGDAFIPGLWSRYTKAPTPTPRFLKLRLRLLHKSSICINNGKPVRHFIATT